MRPDEAAEVARWVQKAMHDISAAERLFTPSCLELDVIAFHCQQAAEKLLKAYLVARSVPFQKIHDLTRLVDLCLALDADFEQLREAAEQLNPFAVMFRYPGPAEPTRLDVERAFDSMRTVRSFVERRL